MSLVDAARIEHAAWSARPFLRDDSVRGTETETTLDRRRFWLESVRVLDRSFALASVLAALEDTPVVAVNGARQVGKSTLMLEVMRRHDDMELVTFDNAAQRRAAMEDPDGFVERRAKTLIIDEIQLVPALMRSIKATVDRDLRPGRFVVTGSTRLLATPGMTESLAGLMEVIELWPLSRAEIDGANGGFIDRAFAGLDAVSCRSDVTKDDYLDLVCVGGFPEPLGRAAPRRRPWFDSYAGAVNERVVNEIADVRRAGEIRSCSDCVRRGRVRR